MNRRRTEQRCGPLPVAVLVAAEERVVLYEQAIPDEIAAALAGQLAAHVTPPPRFLQRAR